MKTQGIPGISQAQIAEIYNQTYSSEQGFRESDAHYRWVLRRLDPQPGGHLLDVACGEGHLAYFAINECKLKVTALDLSRRATELARLRVGENIVTRANGETLPFSDQSFDYLTNLGSLEHYLDPARGAKEMRRVLRPGGKAAILLPNSFYLADILWHTLRTGYSVSHRQPLERFSTHREWQDFLLRNGWKVERSYAYNYCWPRSLADWRWYFQRKTRLAYLFFSPFVPFNLAYHFLFICSPGE